MGAAPMQRLNWKRLLLPLLLPSAWSQTDVDELPFRPGKPVVINLGPLMDSDLGLALRDMLRGPEPRMSEGPQMIEEPLEFEQPDLFRGLLKDFGKHLVPAMQSGSGGFQTSVDNGHFRLRASLPGYSMHRSGDGDEPLNVKVIGQTLLVQGQKTTGQMVTSFQRSFPLPFMPDASKVSVNYSAQDGSLLVDVPPKPGQRAKASADPAISESSEDPMEPPSEVKDLFDILGGPQMTVAFADADRRGAKELRSRPRLRGLPILMGGFRNFPNRPMSMDPFGGLWQELSDMPEPVWQEEEQEAEGMEGAAPSTTRALPVARAAEQAPAGATPVVVQPKAAKPFWRLASADMSRSEYLDIVSPQGVELGKIGGISAGDSALRAEAG
ncbi:unnamed protein product [Symbiodinium natans]|uniref:SHSP domain-containing protein n=1 Tax=Symbiodinium natans TaxID=878477 RepID=A0A812PAV7_9DINO|nr:unnamed protein product [Symbiodinium natans]